MAPSSGVVTAETVVFTGTQRNPEYVRDMEWPSKHESEKNGNTSLMTSPMSKKGRDNVKTQSSVLQLEKPAITTSNLHQKPLNRDTTPD